MAIDAESINVVLFSVIDEHIPDSKKVMEP